MNTKIEHVKIPSHFCHHANTTENTNEFKVVQLYINNTNQDLCVVHRNNLPIVLKKTNNFFSASGSFVIRTIYHFGSKEQIVRTITQLTTWKENCKVRATELEIILGALICAYDSCNGHISYHSVTIDREVPMKTIKHHSMIYVNENDILICDPSTNTRIFHPYSEEGILQEKYYEFIDENKVSGVFIELIDNEHSIKSRYMYLAKQLIEIPARHDPSKVSGVYFTKAIHDKLDETHLDCKHFSFEEAKESIGLYKTAEEAETGGNPELLSKISENKLKAELTEQKAKADKEKIASEEYIISLRDQLEAKKMVRNDFYDDRAAVRKDSSEIYKVAGAVIATGLTVFALMSKHNTK
jgi:hypothetical protein